MNHIVKSTLLALLVVVFLQSNGVYAVQAANTEKCSERSNVNGRIEKFEKGDRWCAIGNSITHQGRYIGIIYLYYITRFPNERFELFNCGAGGDTATGTLTRRMDGDILEKQPTVATIMLGINDVWWENSGLFTKENYSRDMEAIVDRLEKEDSRVILITPSPYDYFVKSDMPIDVKRLGLERHAKEVIDLGKRRNIPVVDFYNTMLEITLEQQAVDSTFSLLSRDRVHTKPVADFIMGYTFLKAMNLSPFVSKLVIDVKSSLVNEQINCEVSNLSFEDKVIRFSLIENALPYPCAEIPKEALSLVDFNQGLNQEVVQINGLKQGKYRLFIDDVVMRDYLESELSQGINLATIADTPQSKQAALLSRIISDYNSANQKVRYIVMMEYGQLKKRYEIDDVSTPKIDIVKQFGENSAKFDRYLTLKTEESLWIKKAEELKNQLWNNNQPKIHHYRIERVE